MMTNNNAPAANPSSTRDQNVVQKTERKPTSPNHSQST